MRYNKLLNAFCHLIFSVKSCADFTSLLQIHEYMLSKAPPVPQPSPSENSDEHSQKEESKAQASSQNPEVLPGVEEPPDQAGGDRIVEERELSANSNPNPSGVGTSREVSSNTSRLPQKLDTIVQKPKQEIKVQKSEERLFTLAAIGLTIAIVILLLKKFVNSTEHGAVYMDGS